MEIPEVFGQLVSSFGEKKLMLRIFFDRVTLHWFLEAGVISKRGQDDIESHDDRDENNGNRVCSLRLHLLLRSSSFSRRPFVFVLFLICVLVCVFVCLFFCVFVCIFVCVFFCVLVCVLVCII